jgi:adenylate kinase
LSNLVIFLGPPGAGKGTQAVTISKEKNLAHISTGDMLREHVSNETELGKTAKTLLDEGKLVPDSLVIEMLQERLLSKDCNNGAILDGFPRTIAQAESLNKISDEFKISKVIVFEADRDELIKRILNRGETSGRSDDTEESVSVRLEVYEKDTAPLIEYYEQKNLVAKINAVGEVENIYNSILKEFE